MADATTSAGQYNGGALLITVVLFQVLTWLSVSLRTYVRACLTKTFQLDDWLMVVAQLNFTLSCAFISVGITNGLGHHNSALPQWEEIRAIKWQALATGAYITNMMFIKLSIGVFLLRLASQRRYKWIIWISMGIVGAMSSALFLWDIFQCKPVAAQWDYTIPGYQCVSAAQVVQAAYALSVLSILSDWLYALLPIPMLWSAKMTPQAKATVSVVLGLGIFASVATLIRLKCLADLNDADDILYAGTDPMVWTLIEPGVAIVASSLVTIRPLLRQLRFKGFESTGRSSRSGGFWARYGNNNKLSANKRSRAVSGGPLDAFSEAKKNNDVKLDDLEAGYATPTTTTADSGSKKPIVWTKSCRRGCYSTRESTLTSHNSSRDRELGKSPVRNFSAPLGIAGAGGPPVPAKDDAAMVHNKEAGGKDDEEETNTSPVSPWMISKESNPGLTFPKQQQQQQQTATLRGHVQNGKTMWRSATPNTTEEAEAIQGLRELSSRTSAGRAPFS